MIRTHTNVIPTNSNGRTDSRLDFESEVDDNFGSYFYDKNDVSVGGQEELSMSCCSRW